METLEDIIEAFPEFLTDEPVNGGDLVEFIGNMIARYEDSRSIYLLYEETGDDRLRTIL